MGFCHSQPFKKQTKKKIQGLFYGFLFDQFLYSKNKKKTYIVSFYWLALKEKGKKVFKMLL